ncbi:unnamed protein product [Polarella glacialis]|uniref:RING-type domain-containing protein n=1 Tax=Polarella glacialis TaxID=89957 RepID=A0A813EMB3_POLGL|nr:unnamed protein product [Polarella glacialis]
MAASKKNVLVLLTSVGSSLWHLLGKVAGDAIVCAGRSHLDAQRRSSRPSSGSSGSVAEGWQVQVPEGVHMQINAMITAPPLSDLSDLLRSMDESEDAEAHIRRNRRTTLGCCSLRNRRTTLGPVRSFVGPGQQSQELLCPVCLESGPIADSDKFCKLSSCRHVFHRVCMLQWMARNIGVLSPCPVCRAPAGDLLSLTMPGHVPRCSLSVGLSYILSVPAQMVAFYDRLGTWDVLPAELQEALRSRAQQPPLFL